MSPKRISNSLRNRKYVQYHLGIQKSPHKLNCLLGVSSFGSTSYFLPALPILISDLMEEIVSLVSIWMYSDSTLSIGTRWKRLMPVFKINWLVYNAGNPLSFDPSLRAANSSYWLGSRMRWNYFFSLNLSMARHIA